MKNVYRRMSGMSATADGIADIPPAVREQRAKYYVERELSARLESARTELAAAQAAYDRAKAIVPETAALEAAKAKLAGIEQEMMREAVQ